MDGTLGALWWRLGDGVVVVTVVTPAVTVGAGGGLASTLEGSDRA